MHESVFCAQILAIIGSEREARGFSRVVRVHVEIGRLSCADPQAVLFAWQAIAAETVGHGATLEIARPGGHGRCRACQSIFEVVDRISPCPRCGAFDIERTGGTGLRVTAIEVE